MAEKSAQEQEAEDAAITGAFAMLGVPQGVYSEAELAELSSSTVSMHELYEGYDDEMGTMIKHFIVDTSKEEITTRDAVAATHYESEEIVPEMALEYARDLRLAEERANYYAVRFVVSRGLRFIETTTQKNLREFLMESAGSDGELSTKSVVQLLAGYSVESIDDDNNPIIYKLEPVDPKYDKFISAKMIPVLRELFRVISRHEDEFSKMCSQEDWGEMYVNGSVCE